MSPAAAMDRGRHVGHRHPHVGAGKAEALRHHSDNLIDVTSVIFQGDHPADNVGVFIELVAPEAMTDDHHPARSANLFFREKGAAQHRLQAEHLEKAVGDETPLEIVGLFIPVGIDETPRDRPAVIRRQRDGLENRVLLSPIEEVHRRSLVVVAVGEPLFVIAFPDQHDPVGVRVIQRPHRTPLTMVNTIVVAPMPIASVNTATAVNPGWLRNRRRARRKSFMRRQKRPPARSFAGSVAHRQSVSVSYPISSRGRQFRENDRKNRRVQAIH